jgi:hypothetical protein
MNDQQRTKIERPTASSSIAADAPKHPAEGASAIRKEADTTGGKTPLSRGKVLVLFLSVLTVLFAANLWVILAPVTGEVTAGIALEGEAAASPPWLKAYQRRVLIATSAAYLAFAACGILIIQQVLLPILRIRETTREIAEGNLRNLVAGRYENSLGHLGGMINDIAMNLQEILMLAWNNAHKNAVTADRIAEKYADEIREAAGELRGIAENLRTMEVLVQEYDFDHVQLESGSAVDPEADKSAGKRSSS